jgi:hypothetical protein
MANHNTVQTKGCRRCGAAFTTAANRQVYCSLRCRVLSQAEVAGAAECWLWAGRADKDGYGRLRWQYKEMGAHQASFIAFTGPITPGVVVMHTCDTPACVNPAHLRLGTHQENAEDRNRKGRTRANPNAGDNGRAAARDSGGRFTRVCGV